MILEDLVSNYYFKNGEPDDIATLGSSMMLAVDENSTLDPAIWNDWLNSVKTTTDAKVMPKSMTIQEGYSAAIKFLSFWADLMNSKQIKSLVYQLTFEKWKATAKQMKY